MKPVKLLVALAFTVAACQQPEPAAQKETAQPITGTWQLISNKIITAGDTVIAFPEKGKDEVMIKMYNDSHFSFFKHDRRQGKVAAPVYDSGAGTYKLSGTDYSERLEYCNYREWENHDFTFKLIIRNDTLVQRGIEKIDSLKVNREIIETYVRVP